MITSSNGNIFRVTGPVNSPHKGQWSGALMFPLICTRINGWVNNRETGDLRRHRGHYDVTVMHRQTSNIRRTLVWNKIVDHSDVVGLLQLHVHSRLNAWLQWIGQSNFKTRHEAFKFCDLLRLIPKVGWQIYGPLLKRKHERSISRDLFIWMSHGMFCIQARS